MHQKELLVQRKISLKLLFKSTSILPHSPIFAAPNLYSQILSANRDVQWDKSNLIT